MNEKPRIYVAGHRGMVGSAIIRRLREKGIENIVTRTHAELDLTDQLGVRNFFSEERIEQVYLAAAKVGGIHANNTYPADFIYQNLMMEANVINEASRVGIDKLLFLGSSCIYPKFAPQPITEDVLMEGKLEPTNEPYAVAKIAGIKLCESYNRQYGRDYRSVMPTNLYGPGDNYHPVNSHVIPALVRRFHEAKKLSLPTVAIWGTGAPRREFLYVDDMASACLHVMDMPTEQYAEMVQKDQSHINIGTGSDISIKSLAEEIANIVGFEGRIEFDASKPDGTPRKLLAIEKIKSLGWEPTVSLKEGLRKTYEEFKETEDA